MFYRIFAYLFGYTLIVLQKSPAVATAILKKELPIRKMRIEGDRMILDVLTLSRRSVLRRLAEMGVSPLEICSCGLPHRLAGYRRRYGVMIGLLLFTAILWTSSLFIWEVHVVGNERVDDDTILSELSDLGLHVGSYHPKINVKELCNRYLTDSDEVAWISVNIIGTRAEVQVREFMPDRTPAKPEPCNLVALRDGLIERIELYSGQAVVGVGASVHAGQVLVSGYYQGKNEQVYRLEPSVAKIYARTTRYFTVQLPLSGSREDYTGMESVQKSILFFSEELGPSDRRSPFEKSEESVRSDSLTLFGLPLPVGIRSRIYREIQKQDYTLTEEQAERIAKEQMAKKVQAELSGAEILSVSSSSSCDGVYYTVSWMVYCIEDIAAPTPILK